MFFKKEINLKEAPLGYWEEKSYMLVVPEDEGINPLYGMFDRILAIDDLEIINRRQITDSEPGYMKLKYKGDEYEVGFFPSEFIFQEFCIDRMYYFTNEEIGKLRNAKRAMTIYMGFNNNPKKSYHLQLKLALAIMPDLIGVMDESAEKLLPPKWVKMTANSNVVPSANDLYTTHAVSSKKGEVWLHTHGLCRCGVTELEILQSDMQNYNNHYNLITTFASYLIDKCDSFNPRESSAYIGVSTNKQPIVVTCKSWVDGIKEYKNLNLGNVSDRRQGHNSKTSIIFIYKSEEDENQKKISKVSEYNNLWGENPILFISNEETARMKALAMEHFDFVKEALKNKENKIIIKVGLPINNDKNNCEHIWFELLEFDNEKFKAKLTQEPYNIENMHEGDEAWYTIEDVTDWLIYTKKFPVNPSNVYLLVD